MNRTVFRQRGFTLLEVIAVLIVMGVLTAIAVSRVTADVYTLKSGTEVIKSHLRYAQGKAMNSDSAWGINFSSASTYSLFKAGSTADTVLLIGQDSVVVTLPSGMTVTTGVVAFDEWGKPSTGAGATSPATADIVLSVSYRGDSESITVTRNTGYIP